MSEKNIFEQIRDHEAPSDIVYQDEYVTAFKDISHLLRPSHLSQLRAILDDKEASANDHFVAMELLKNANIAAAGVLPMCQDTGTAIVVGSKGEKIWTGGNDKKSISRGSKGSANNALKMNIMIVKNVLHIF